MPAVKGSEIRERRQRMGVKPGEFAARAGVNRQTFANIECGSQKVASLEVIVRIARELPDTEPDELLAGDEEDLDESARAAALWKAATSTRSSSATAR